MAAKTRRRGGSRSAIVKKSWVTRRRNAPPKATLQARATKRWLQFGPMILPGKKSERQALALSLKAKRATLSQRLGSGIFRSAQGTLRVTKHGGPAAKGLYAHKAYTAQGARILRRKGKVVTIPKKGR